MRMTVLLATAAVAATSAAPIAPIALAAADSPVETIGLLEAQGYTVNVDRVGSAPLKDCEVTSVRNPQTVTKLVRVENRHGHRGGDGAGNGDGNGDGNGADNGNGNGNGNRRGGKDDYELVEVVVSKSISVSLDCAR